MLWYIYVCVVKYFFPQTENRLWRFFFFHPGFGLYAFWNARICNKKYFFKYQHRGFSREENPRQRRFSVWGNFFFTIYIYIYVCVCVCICAMYVGQVDNEYVIQKLKIILCPFLHKVHVSIASSKCFWVVLSRSLLLGWPKTYSSCKGSFYQGVYVFNLVVGTTVLMEGGDTISGEVRTVTGSVIVDRCRLWHKCSRSKYTHSLYRCHVPMCVMCRCVHCAGHWKVKALSQCTYAPYVL